MTQTDSKQIRTYRVFYRAEGYLSSTLIEACGPAEATTLTLSRFPALEVTSVQMVA